MMEVVADRNAWRFMEVVVADRNAWRFNLLYKYGHERVPKKENPFSIETTKFNLQPKP